MSGFMRPYFAHDTRKLPREYVCFFRRTRESEPHIFRVCNAGRGIHDLQIFRGDILPGSGGSLTVRDPEGCVVYEWVEGRDNPVAATRPDRRKIQTALEYILTAKLSIEKRRRWPNYATPIWFKLRRLAEEIRPLVSSTEEKWAILKSQANLRECRTCCHRYSWTEIQSAMAGTGFPMFQQKEVVQDAPG